MAEKKSPVLSVRDWELKQRVERLATLERRRSSQMARIFLEDQVAAKEKELGLPPIADDPGFQAAV